MPMDADDMFPVLLWLFVTGALLVQCMAADACRFDAYASCMRNAPEPGMCEHLLPEGWRR